MTQVNGAQRERGKSAWRKRADGRTLARRRADLEAQVRDFLGTEQLMALTDLSQVKTRLKDLHRRLERREGRRVTQYEIADEINVPYRTFQSWENGEVETEGRNYDRIAEFYSRRLGETVTRNHILFGQEEEPERQAPPGDDSALNGDPMERLRQIEEKLDEILEWIDAQGAVGDAAGADPESAPADQQSDAERASSGKPGRGP